MLSQAQVEQYHRDGYVVPDYRVSSAVLDSIKARHAALVERKPEFRDYCPALLDQDPGFFDYCNDPAILDMVEQLIGHDIALWNSSFFAKPAYNGRRTPWHQDGEYWPITPLATCTVWLAVDASTRQNGCLQVIEGSHRDQRLRKHNSTDATDVNLNQELDASEYDEARARYIELEPGQISLHDVYLLHGADANVSPQSRRGMTMRFMPTTSHFDRALASAKSRAMNITDHAERPVYLMRGIDRCGKNRFINA